MPLRRWSHDFAADIHRLILDQGSHRACLEVGGSFGPQYHFGGSAGPGPTSANHGDAAASSSSATFCLRRPHALGRCYRVRHFGERIGRQLIGPTFPAPCKSGTAHRTGFAGNRPAWPLGADGRIAKKAGPRTRRPRSGILIYRSLSPANISFLWVPPGTNSVPTTTVMTAITIAYHKPE